MKPLLKPSKGWKYRVIVCDQDGLYVFDDSMHPVQVIRITPYLLHSLIELEKRASKENDDQ